MDQLEPIPRTPPINPNLEMEEGDIEHEKLQELEDEARGDSQEDREREALTGVWLGFTRTVTGRDTGIDSKDIKKLLAAKKSLHSIPAAKRGDVYRYFIDKLNRIMRKLLKEQLAKYEEAVIGLRFAKVHT